MNWKKIEKKVGDTLGRVLAEGDFEVTCEVVDRTLKKIEFARGNGPFLRIERGDYSGLQVFVPAEPETEKRHAVKVKVADESFRIEDETFESKYDAERLKEKLDARFGDDVEVTIEEVQVPVE